MRTAIRKNAIFWVPPVLLLLGGICRRPLLWAAHFAAEHILFCPFYELTGLYCPGCGSTRSVLALMHGNVPLSLHENPSGFLIAAVLVLCYLERLARHFGKRLRLIPRSFVFWGVVFGLFCVWDVVRNAVPWMQPGSI